MGRVRRRYFNVSRTALVKGIVEWPACRLVRDSLKMLRERDTQCRVVDRLLVLLFLLHFLLHCESDDLFHAHVLDLISGQYGVSPLGLALLRLGSSGLDNVRI